VNLKNIAGHDVSLFLFRFELRGNGIDFVLNEAIAEDIYPEVDEKMKPLVHACCETLLRHKNLSASNTIMDGNLLASGEFEVMLSEGMGQHFAPNEKKRLFQDAKHIADFLAVVMDRRTQELSKGTATGSSHNKVPISPEKIKKGLEALGTVEHLQEKMRWFAEGRQIRPGLRQLRPEDLPPDIIASSGYDHRGHCYVFEHKTLGELGRIVMIKVREQEMLMQAELYTGQENQKFTLATEKKELFETVVTTVHACFDANFPKCAHADNSIESSM
jgi:hypothetical protein